MSFQVSLLLTADGEVASAEVRKLGAATRETAADAETLGKKGSAAAGSITGLGKAADQADDKITSLGAAERRTAQDAKTLAKEKNKAAMATGNLVAQGNDLVVMMMAGQNPFQLAIQQGTQITQVIGPMGAAGAYKALKTAVLSMINPLNLVTLASIAGAAAFVGWLTEASEEAESFDDRLSALDAALKRYTESSKAARVSTSALRAEYGDAAEDVQRLLKEQEEAARRDLKFEINATIKTVIDESSLDLNSFRLDDRVELSFLFDFDVFYGAERRAHRAMIDDVIDGYEELGAHADAELGTQIEKIQSLAEAFRTAAQFDGSFTKAEHAEYQKLLTILQKALELKAKLGSKAEVDSQRGRQISAELSQELAIRQAIALHGEESAQVENLRLGFARENFQAKLNELRVSEELKASYRALWDANEADKQRASQDAARKSAEAMLVELQEQATIQRAIYEHGANSVRVVELRQQAERRAYEEMLDSKNISAEMKTEILAAYDAKQKLANVNIVSGISAAADQAARLAQQLGISLATAMGIVNLQSSKSYSGRGADPRAFENGGSQADYQNRLDYTPIQEIIDRFNRSSGRGGGANAAKREREALARLIASEKEQLDLLRETDPVQKEMIRNRETLKNATDAERAAVEQIISQRIAEQQAMEGLQERQEFFNQTLYDAFDGLLLQGESLEDVLGNVARAIAQAALQAAILGEGPLARLFGISTPLFSFSSGGEIPAYAGGGKIYGPGGGADDKVLMWGSSGEFMMNAPATARYRHLLEAMNAGAVIPGLATGGAVDGSQAAGFGALGGASVLRVELADGLKAQLVETSVGQSVEIMGQQLEHYDRNLGARVQEIQSDKRKMG